MLLTGVDTILGYHVARALVSSGFTVNVLLPGELVPRGSAAGWRVYPGRTTDPEACLEALDGASAVFHFESGHLSSAGPVATRAFLEGTRNLLLAMSRSGVEDLVFGSSALVFRPGTPAEPGDEGSPSVDDLPALACLDALRAAGELVRRYCDSDGARAVTVNPTVVMGSHDLPGGVGWQLLELVLSSPGPAAAGSLNIVRAADAAGAAVRALGRGRAGRSYILGGENVTFGELAELAERARAGRAVPGARPRRGRLKNAARRLVPGVRAPESPLLRLAGADLCYSASGARELLSLEGAPLESTVAEAVDWYLSRAW